MLSHGGSEKGAREECCVADGSKVRLVFMAFKLDTGPVCNNTVILQPDLDSLKIQIQIYVKIYVM